MKRQQTTKLKLPMFKTLHDIEALTQFLFTLLQNTKHQLTNHITIYTKKITYLVIHKN